jgi:nucleoside 2-deoxyribosyltransferase
MPDPANCPLCQFSATFRPITADRFEWECQRCGNYSIVGSAESVLRGTPIQNRGAVSGYIRRQNSMGVTPNLGSNDVPRLRTLTKPPFRERVERYLLAVADKAQTLDALFKIGDEELIGVSYSDHPNDLVVILEYLRQEQLMSNNFTERERLTAKGYIAADELRARRAASSQAFVAMWFNDDMEPVYKQGIKPAIERAGFTPRRISDKEHANKIDDEIIAEIRRSAFLVADFTGQRQNVYFETGFAIGLARQPIWTCRKDEIKHLHFDIRQYNCIDWEDAAELAFRLQRRIEALFGRGPLAPLTG